MGSFPIVPPAGGFGVLRSLTPLLVGSFSCVVTTASNCHWVLGFKQSRFHHVAQVCGYDYATRLRASPLFSPCSVSRWLSPSSKTSDLEVIPPNLSCLRQESNKPHSD